MSIHSEIVHWKRLKSPGPISMCRWIGRFDEIRSKLRAKRNRKRKMKKKRQEKKMEEKRGRKDFSDKLDRKSGGEEGGEVVSVGGHNDVDAVFRVLLTPQTFFRFLIHQHPRQHDTRPLWLTQCF